MFNSCEDNVWIVSTTILLLFDSGLARSVLCQDNVRTVQTNVSLQCCHEWLLFKNSYNSEMVWTLNNSWHPLGFSFTRSGTNKRASSAYLFCLVWCYWVMDCAFGLGGDVHMLMTLGSLNKFPCGSQFYGSVLVSVSFIDQSGQWFVLHSNIVCLNTAGVRHFPALLECLQ